MLEKTRAIMGTRIGTETIRTSKPCGCQDRYRIEKYFIFCPYCGNKIDRAVEDLETEIEKTCENILNADNLRVFHNSRYLYIGRYVENTYTSIPKIDAASMLKAIYIIFSTMELKGGVSVGLYMDTFDDKE